jgi:2-amino-4-hydroxy-6-hydroxymethyldihydropteridine diphosphokinase
MTEIYLLLGSNLGDKKVNIERVKMLIENRLGKITRQSSLVETAPWGFETDDWFYNQIVVVETKVKKNVENAVKILYLLHKIEAEVGRKRTMQKAQKRIYESRIIDVDILFWEDMQIETEELTIPHKEIKNRKFVMDLLSELRAHGCSLQQHLKP